MLYGEIKYELPEPLSEPQLIKNFFPDEIFARVVKAVNNVQMGPDGPLQYHTMLGRWEATILFDEDIENFCLEKAKQIFNDQTLKRAYFFLARYQIVDGCIPHLWNHTDQNGTQTTIDIAIENTAQWSIDIEGQNYFQEPNDAIVFAGQQHIHGRPAFPTNDPNLYTTVMFMHFTQPDHWFQSHGSDGMRYYGRDGDIRFFNRERFVAMPDRPLNQPICPCHSYETALNLYEFLEDDLSQPTEACDMELLKTEELAPGIMSYDFSKLSAKILKGLSQNALYKLWEQAKVSKNSESVVAYETRNCFTYFLNKGHLECHPQDPIRRLLVSLDIASDKAIALYKNRYNLNNLVSNQWGMARYEIGHMFINHYDDSPQFPRTASLSFFLNEDFTGGELVFPEFDLTIKPRAGQMIIFPSGSPYLHRVNPIITGIRYAAVRWYTHYDSFNHRGV